MSNPKHRQDRLDQTITAIQHRFGPQGLRQGMAPPVTVPHLPTGFAALDQALAIGGIPRGKLTVLRGALTSGKRVLAALLVAQAQRAGRQSCAYLDLAGACDAELLARCGVALDRLFVIQPTDGREALDMLLTLTERKELACLVLDEWGSIEADRETRPLAAQVLDQVVQSLARSGVTLIVLDGLVAPWQGVVAAFTDPAHSALAHHDTVRLALRHQRWVMLGPDMRGYEVAVTIERNKLGQAGQTVAITIRYNGTVRGDGL